MAKVVKLSVMVDEVATDEMVGGSMDSNGCAMHLEVGEGRPGGYRGLEVNERRRGKR